MKDFDQRGVEVETKKVMAIESAPIIIEDEVEVDEAMVIVSVAVADVAIVMDMSILGCGGRPVSSRVKSTERVRRFGWEQQVSAPSNDCKKVVRRCI